MCPLLKCQRGRWSPPVPVEIEDDIEAGLSRQVGCRRLPGHRPGIARGAPADRYQASLAPQGAASSLVSLDAHLADRGQCGRRALGQKSPAAPRGPVTLSSLRDNLSSGSPVGCGSRDFISLAMLRRRLQGKILSETASRVTDRWFVSFAVDVPDTSHLPPAENQSAVGPRSLHSQATLSTGESEPGHECHELHSVCPWRGRRWLGRHHPGETCPSEAGSPL